VTARLHAAHRGAWLRFAAVALLVGAAANALYGVVGLLGDDHLLDDDLLFGAVTLWGGVNLVIAATQLMIAVLILTDAPSGAALGILIAGLNAIAQMMAIGAYPIWSVTVLVVDLLIIYALTACRPWEPT
jgi:hypothetical protein